MAGHDAPPVGTCPPDARVPKGPGEGDALECSAHLHPDADDRHVAEQLNMLFTWVELTDLDRAAAVCLQIILLSVDRPVGADEMQRVIEKSLECDGIASELRCAQREFGGVQWVFRWHHHIDKRYASGLDRQLVCFTEVTNSDMPGTAARILAAIEGSTLPPLGIAIVTVRTRSSTRVADTHAA